MPSLLVIQWGTIGLFMFLYFLQGFMRGTSKSLYYTLVTVITAGVTIWLISMVSLNLVLSSSFTFESLINMIQGMTGNILPDEIVTYLVDPQITPVVIAIIDLVLRIVFYFVLFPVIKTLLTWIIFVPIWKFFIKKPLLARQNDKARVMHEESRSSKKFVPSKRLKKTIFSRLGGGLSGAVHGFIVAFLFLLPVIIFSGFLTGFSNIANLEQENEYQTLDTGGLPGGLPFALPGDIDIEDYLLQIEEMNEKGLGGIMKQIVINGQPLDRFVFDRMLTTTIKQEDLEDVNINWVEEVENIFGIVSVVLEGGYIDPDFDLNTIGEDNLEDIEQIFNYIGRSNVLGYMIPYATRFGLENILVDEIGVNLYERDASREALNAFEDISWDEEFSNLYGIIEALLKFGTVGELQAYASNPELIFELTPEEAESLTDIIRAFGELETLVLINVALDYATTMEEVQNFASWIDETEREAYLQERFSFILEDPNFFVGDSGEFYHIADFVEALFTDEFGDVNLASIINNASDPSTYLTEENGAYFGFLIDQLVEIRLLMEAIPIGIDFGVYNALDDRISDELQDDIAARLEEVVWSDEITNISDIYVEATKLGLQAILGDNPDYFALVDNIAVNHIDELRNIVSLIFEESEVVNIGLEIAVPIVLDTALTDPNLRALVDEALEFDETTGGINFNFGQEINNVLTVVETIFKFSTASELASITSMTTEAQLQVFANFGSLTEQEYNAFKEAIEELQVLDRVGTQGLTYVRDTLGITQVYVPSEVALGEELTAITGLLYYAAKYTHENLETAGLLEDIDFAPLFNDPVFRSHILATDLENHSSLLLQTLAHNIKVFSEDPAISGYLSVPENLLLASPEDELWADELNNILGFVFDFAGSFETADDFTLSLRDVLTVANDPMQAPISLFTRFSDLAEADLAFGSLDQSILLRSSVKKAIDTYGATLSASLGGYEVKTPSIAVEDDALKEDTLVDFIHGIASLASGMNDTLGYETFGEAIGFETFYEYIRAYNALDNTDIEAFSDITLLRGFIGDALLNPDFQAYARDLVRNTGFVNPSDDFLAFTRPNDEMPASDLSELLIGIKDLQINEAVYYNPTEGIYSYLQTLTDAQLDSFFDGTLIREIFTFALSDPGIISSLAGAAETAYQGVQSSQALLGQVNPNFEAIVGGLGSYKRADELFDTDELKALITALNELEINSSADLSALSNLETLNSKIYNTTVIEKLFQSNWLYDQVNYVFTNEDFQQQLADIVSVQVLNQTGFDKTFTKEDLSFALPKYGLIESGGEREGGIKVSEIKAFLLAGTRLNWTGLELGAGTALLSNLSNALLETGYDSQRHIDAIFESGILVAIFDKALNFEYNGLDMDEVIVSYLNNNVLAANPTFGGLTLTADILHYDTRAYDANQVLRKEEIIEMIEAVSFIDFSAPIGINTFYLMTQDGTFDEIFDSYIIHSFISNALNNEAVQAFGVTKGNEAQAIVSLPDDFLSVDPVLMDGDLFKQEEIENILIAMHTLGLTDSAGFASIGLATFSELNGRNVDPETSEDDFDRVMKAHYIYIILDRALKIESLGEYVGTLLGDALGVDVADLDLTPHPAMLSTDLTKPVELGRVPKDEFRRMFNSFGLLGDIGAIGLNTFTDLIDPYEDEDGFSEFIASDFIYIVLARLFENEGFGDYVGDLLAGVFGDDQDAPNMTPPSDAKGQVPGALDEDLMTRSELRNLMVSFKLIGADDPSTIGIGSVMGLIDQNYDAIDDEDDMDRFLSSKYIQDKLSFLLLSESVIELIANGMFDPTDFDLPDKALTTVDGNDRILEDELYNIFAGLKTLGITDEDSLSTIGPDTLFSLTEPEVDSVVESDYLYTVIDLFLKGQDTFEIPLSALNPNTDPDYPDKVKKSEITDIFKTLSILDVTDLDTFEPTEVTIAQINEILAETDSAIVLSLLSQGIIDAIGADKIPDEAYEAENLLTKEEVEALVAALEIIAGNEDASIGDVDVENITVGQVQQIDLTPTGSYIIKQLISDEILNLIDVDNLPEDAYAPLSSFNGGTVLLGVTLDGPLDPLRRLSDAELQEIVAALYILADDPNNVDPEFDPANVLVTAINTEATVGQAQQLKTNNSLVIRSLITDAVVDNLGATVTIHEDAYDETYTTLLSVAEINALLDAMYILAGEDDTVLISAISTNVTVGQTQDLKGNASLIMRQLFTDQIVDAIDPLDEGKIPAEAFDLDKPTMFTQQELDAMLDALYILANNNPPFGYPGHDPLFNVDDVLVANVSTDVSVGQASELKGTESYTIKQLVSDNVIDVIGVDNIPVGAYIDSNPANRLTDAEIDHMIDALVILAEPEDPYAVLVTDLSTDVTVGQVKDLNLLPSLITKQLISDSIIDSIGVDNIPDEAYIDSNPLNRLSDDELDAMIIALDVLAGNDDSVLVANISTDVTVGQALDMKQTESFIIQQLLSDAIIDAIDPLDEGKIPLEAYIDGDSNNRLLQTEIDHMIDALYVLSNEDEDVLVSDITTDLTIGQLKGLNAIPSIIMKKQMSDQIIDAVGVDNVPLDAYIDQDNTKNLTDTELTEMIEALEILAGSVVPGDVDHILVSAVSTDVTVGQTKQLDQDNESLIIKQIISDSIIDMIGVDGIPTAAYIDGDSNNRLTDAEISNMVDALDILSNSNDALLVTDISTDITIGQLKGLNALPSLITQKLISDSIIDAVGVDNVPLDAYIDQDNTKNLTPTETTEMILALEILAGSVVPGDVDHILVSAVSTDVTVGQTKQLDQDNDSLIIKQIISDAIVDMIGVDGIPTAAYIDGDSNNRLTDAEISNMVDALDILSDNNDALLVTDISTDVTIGQLKDLNGLPSLITQKLISDSIIEAVGVDNVPLDAYIDEDNTKNLTQTEVDDMILALEILAGSTVPGDVDHILVSAIIIDVTVGQTQSLKTNGSVIIKQILSDNMVTMLTTSGIEIPVAAYRNNDDEDRLTNDEIGYMIDALFVLSGEDNNAKVDEIVFDEAALSVDTLQSFDENSLILNRVISTGLITNLPNIPDESYVVVVDPLDPDYKKDIRRIEINSILEALDILGIGTSGAGGIGTSQITFGDLDTILLLGTTGQPNEHPLGFSPIVAHIMSTPMIEAVSDVRGGYDYGIPSTAYRNDHDLLYEEIVGLVDALKLIGDVQPEDEDTTALSDVTINPQSFNGNLILSLIAEDSLIVYRLISIGINDANLENEDARAEVGDDNYDAEVMALATPLIYDIKITEMTHIAESMNVLGITSIQNVATDITVPALKALTPQEITDLVEDDTNGPNTIIYYLISDVVDPSNNLFDTLSAFDPVTYPDPDVYYVYDGPTRVRLLRTSIATALSEL